MSNETKRFGAVLQKLRKLPTLRWLSSAFKEKPSVTLPDYEFEHLMLYHGLVGTSPEDQPQFKDVRADIFDAILKKSPVQMAIALKLPPLWWEDKLTAIFAETHNYRDEVILCLLPEENPLDPPDAQPLRHPDWRVRANAARILAGLEIHEATPALVRALEDQDESQKAAFCHIAWSLARLRTPQARMALTKQLEHDEPWLRVDAIANLAKWPLPEVSADLMQAMLAPNKLNDYAAVAIVKEQPLSKLLSLIGPDLEGALEVALGLTQAARDTFANDTTAGADQLEACVDMLAQLANEQPTPRRLIAALNAAALHNRLDVKVKLTDANYLDLVNKYLQDPQNLPNGELKHAIELAGMLKLEATAATISQWLKPDFAWRDECIDALASLGSGNAAPHMVQLAQNLVDIEDRTSRQASKQPVFEDDQDKARSYWLILKALGRMATSDSIAFLLLASKDFAPDKRQQAIVSLIGLSDVDSATSTQKAEIAETVRKAITDPAQGVRLAALQGARKLNLKDLSPEVEKMTRSKDASLARQARETLAHLR